MDESTSTCSRADRRAERRRASADRHVDHLLDQVASGSGLVASCGVGLIVIAALGMWLGNPDHRAVAVVLVVLWALGIALLLVAASFAARYEYRIARIEGATRSSATWRAIRAWFRTLVFWMP